MKIETGFKLANHVTRVSSIGPAVFGMWSGGHFLQFGEDIGAEKLKELVRNAYQKGFRAFMTADVYGNGESDEILGEALAQYDRSSYQILGAIGHDFYKGIRNGEKGYPRFTDSELRGESEYDAYIQMAARKSLERLKTNYFDVLFLHNPDQIGYSSKTVWNSLKKLKDQGMTRELGIAPGPANGFSLDMIGAFEDFENEIDWAMVILNPFEPWPGQFVLEPAKKHHVKLLIRVVDYGGIFHESIKPGAVLGRGDHRSFRPQGWVEQAWEKMEKIGPIAQKYHATPLQLACQWNLSQPSVVAVVPTLIQEKDPAAKSIETQMDELIAISKFPKLTQEEIEHITEIGNNKNCMALKGGTPQFQGKAQGDQWPISKKNLEVARRWKIEPDRDLYYADDPRDLREKGAWLRGKPQFCSRRLFIQFLAYGNCANPTEIVELIKEQKWEAVVYADINDAKGIGLLFLNEDPDFFVTEKNCFLNHDAFSRLQPKPELTMLGRTYSSGREPDLEDWLLHKPRKTAFNLNWPWAIWYPLRRKGEFEKLSPQEQGKILLEHALIGRNYGNADYVHDIRLACHGLDKNDNEFVIGLTGPELFPLSHIIQTMRKTKQTSEYIQSLGPFFVGKAIYQYQK